MIRDMELLLNKVCDNEIKSYLHEALNCYSVGAYRACVIISVIAGIHDLHKKLKDLAPSHKEISDLENDVSQEKNKLKPYEKHLIEGCSTIEIDLLNPSESKDLLRCLDIRNSCAHPSDYVCTAECSRYVFSTIIDILASKPALLGNQCIGLIYDKINSDTFFHSYDKNEIKSQVENLLKSCNSRMIIPLAKKVVEGIKNDLSNMNYNKLYFFSNLSQALGDSLNKIIDPLFLDSKFHSKLMVILSTNINIIENLSNENIKRLIHIFKGYTILNNGYNNIIIETLLSDRLSDQEYDKSIIELLNYNYNKMTDNQIDIWLAITEDSAHSKNNRRISLVKSDYSDYIENLDVSKSSFESQKFQDVFISCNNEDLYKKLVFFLSIKVSDFEYHISNEAVEELKKLSPKFIDKLSPSSISNIIYSILRGNDGYGNSVKYLFKDIENIYFYKCYTEKVIPEFDFNEFKNMMKHRLESKILSEFVKKVSKKIENFDEKFIAIAKEYIDEKYIDESDDIDVINEETMLRSCIKNLNEHNSNESL